MQVKEHTEHWHRSATGETYRAIYELAKSYIDQNHHRPITIADFSVSSNYSIRIIQRSLSFHGTTWRKVLRGRRVFHAALLLRETDLSISEIASAVGYNDPNSLTRSFKTHCDISPTAYRLAAA
jgi:two-component system response regulator YesN